MKDIHEKLAAFVDRLPAGYPRTESGVELRILRKLFTPEEAGLFMHLTLLGEEPNVIAQRAKLPVEVISQRLDEMEKKGFAYGIHRKGKPVEYIAYQFIIGFWEGAVNRLDLERVEDFEEYFTTFGDAELWPKAPQLCTFPVGEAIPIQAEAMPYENAKKVVEANSNFAVTKCICRKEFQILGKGYGKPLETCMSFGLVAENIIQSGRGRKISREEMLAILKQADEAGLVLQPSNTKKPKIICACCGDCCGVFRLVKTQRKPSSYVSSPYIVAHDDAICSGCGNCVDRCQMEAIKVLNYVAEVNLDRCIGCGLCVSTCTTRAMSLVRKPDSEQRFIPDSLQATTIQLGQARGVLSNTDQMSMLIKSKIDRLVARI